MPALPALLRSVLSIGVGNASSFFIPVVLFGVPSLLSSPSGRTNSIFTNVDLPMRSLSIPGRDRRKSDPRALAPQHFENSALLPSAAPRQSVDRKLDTLLD